MFKRKSSKLTNKTVQKLLRKIQKQPFTDVLQNGCSYKFRNINRKTPGRPATMLKRDPIQVFSWEYCEIFKNRFFIEHLQWLLLKILVRPKLYRNCAFLQNFHTRKLGEIMVFYAVNINTCLNLAVKTLVLGHSSRSAASILDISPYWV